ncbi:MAG: cytochrome c [Verrucomicrobiota bacterium]|nr:cytochrome c [Verrucomicrobiota bacterium]
MIVRLVCLTILMSGWSKAAEGIDHEETIRALRDGEAKAGRALYALHCASCHGKEGDLAVNPLARRFAVDELKFGSDPYSLWKTISYGNGLMFRWDAVLSPKERYEVVHHLREEIIRERNPGQYFEPDEAYYEGLNERAAADGSRRASAQTRCRLRPG